MLRAFTASRLALAACLLLPLIADAAGLGRLAVQSALGQPLRAEVEIVSMQPREADGLVARVASPEAYRMAGIEFNPALLNIRVAVERRNGRPVLSLTSTQPINEPFVELLLELQWSTGRLVREYTFLLDPVEYKPPQPVAVAPPPPSAPIAKPAPAAPAVVAKPLASEPPKSTGTYRIRRGDTLSKVARETKPAGVSVNQMLVALYQANQKAFMRNSMYLMRSGEILRIPDSAAAAAISPAEATRMVRAQGADFDEYRRNLGAAVAAAPAKPAPAPQRETPGRITPKKAEPAPRDAKDQIKLSKLDSAKPAAPVSRAAAEDDRTALNRALKESQSRVSDLEKQVTDLQKLIELKNQQLALLEQKASKPAAAAAAPVPPAATPAAEPAKAAPVAPKPAAEAPKPAAPAPKPAPAAAPKKPAAAPPSPSLMDEFLENPLALGGLAGVIALLIGYGAWAWRRKKASQSEGGGFSSIAAASAASETAGAGEPSPEVQAGIAAAQSAPAAGEEVDPIAEADVYLAYGRDAQAETILKDAIAGNPERIAFHAKLLEIYAQRRDTASFERTALQVKSLSGGAGPEWQKARSLGRSIDPDNGLYGTRTGEGEAMVTQPAAASPTVDFDLGGATSPGSGKATAAALDFDIGATTQGDQAPPAFKPGDTVVMSPSDREAAVGKMDFDIGAVTQSAEPAGPAPAAPAAPEAPSAMDFDLDFDLGEAKPAAPAGSSVDPKWQEVATKLDLAKAYEEMGDKNGARELLNEVLKDGDAAQQEEATRLLAKLG
ncbi:MAG: pilus assembly protein [Betaproteobacteria bacterium]|nr:MAG: pilus assembly protein [Betaproteobacteria bacterium]